MFFLRRWIRKYIYGLVIEEESVIAQALSWHRAFTTCVQCPLPIAVDAAFCPHCGAAQRHTTAQVKLVNARPVVAPQTVTGVIKTYHMPGERPIQTLGRLGREKNKNVR